MNTSTLSRADRTVPERGVYRWTGVLNDETGTPIPLGSLQTVRLTITDARTGHKLVDAADIKNTGRGSIHATSGELTLTLGSSDNVMVNANLSEEAHEVTIDFTWNSGEGRFWHVIELWVTNHPGIV